MELWVTVILTVAVLLAVGGVASLFWIFRDPERRVD